jgi:tRNA A-37 threonylcarbamoyl transferase component Bud32
MGSVAEAVTYQLADGRTLECRETVRLLPGKRQVCVGSLDGRPVFVKLYLDPRRGRRHWQRELAGLTAFREGGILSAELLYAGEVAGKGWPVIVLAKIPEPLSLKAAWAQADEEQRERLLQRMTLLLARQHQAGILQTDLHLDNFVLSGDEFYSLDGAGVVAISRPIGPDSSLENLALLLAQLLPEWDAWAPTLYERYMAERGWRRGPGGEDLRRRVRRQRKVRWREYRDKLFRECTDFVCRRDGSNRLMIAARQDLTPELEALLADPDASFPGREQALKNGNTCTVWAAQAGGVRLVIKRYNVKHLWHGVKLSVRRGRAFISWENAHRLRFHGIATPRPIALLRRKQGALRPVVYFLMERVAGIGAQEWFTDPGVTWDEKRQMADRIARLFGQLKEQRISHGDMKASNILLVAGEPMLIDLDAMHQHRMASAFNKAWSRDMHRFMRNWEGHPELEALFREAFKDQLD